MLAIEMTRMYPLLEARVATGRFRIQSVLINAEPPVPQLGEDRHRSRGNKLFGTGLLGTGSGNRHSLAINAPR